MRLNSNTLSIAIGAALMSLPVAAVMAQTALPPVSVGAGIQTSFKHSEVDVPGSADVDDFNLDSARIYLSGKATDTIGIMFNTEYNGATETIGVIDAVAQFAFSDKINIWAGRFLPPSDRANLYGPYYSNHWGVYTDGVQDGYPFETTGRDDGVMYWGQYGIAKVSFGVFDVQGLAKGMGMPGVAGARREVHDARAQVRGHLVVGDRIEPDLADEAIRRTLDRRPLGLNLHAMALLAMLSADVAVHPEEIGRVVSGLESPS